MRSPSYQSLVPIVSLAVVVFAAFAVAWAVSPEGVRGTLLLAATIVTLLLYAGLFLAQRRRHW